MVSFGKCGLADREETQHYSLPVLYNFPPEESRPISTFVFSSAYLSILLVHAEGKDLGCCLLFCILLLLTALFLIHSISVISLHKCNVDEFFLQDSCLLYIFKKQDLLFLFHAGLFQFNS